jgi:hypothetical protein
MMNVRRILHQKHDQWEVRKIASYITQYAQFSFDGYCCSKTVCTNILMSLLSILGGKRFAVSIVEQLASHN